MKLFTVFSVIDGVVRHHYVCQSESEGVMKMEELAKQYVIDCVGKNNFVNTLLDRQLVTSYPAGYVLKYAQGEKKEDVDIPSMALSYINQIYILYTTKTETGRLWSSIRTSVTTKGYFAIDTVKLVCNLSTNISSASKVPMKKPDSDNTSVTITNYNSVVQELMQFNRNNLRNASDPRLEDIMIMPPHYFSLTLPSIPLTMPLPPPLPLSPIPLTMPPPPPLSPIPLTMPPPPPLPLSPCIPIPPPLPMRRGSSDGLDASKNLPLLDECMIKYQI